MNFETDEDTDGRPAASPRRADFVQSLARGLAVIRAFDAEHPSLTLSEVAVRTGLTRAVARRFLHTLVALEYVHTDGKRFTLRPRMLELGYSYLSALSLPERALPHMERLVQQVQESCSLSVLDGDEIVYVARVPTRRIMAVAISVGTRFPAHATSMGRVLLAHLPPEERTQTLRAARRDPLTSHTVVDQAKLASILETVRDQGYALVRQELDDGLQSLAVPVRNGRGEVVAAMNLSAPLSRGTSHTMLQELLPPLQATARAVSGDTGD